MIAAYCSCGGSVSATSTPPEASTRIVEMFWQVHQGEGHDSVSAEEYGKARDKRTRAAKR